MKFKELLLTFSSTLVTLLILFYFEKYVIIKQSAPGPGQHEEGVPAFEKLAAKTKAPITSKGKVVQSVVKAKADTVPVVRTIPSVEAVESPSTPSKDAVQEQERKDTATVTPTTSAHLKATKDIITKVPIVASSTIHSKTVVSPVKGDKDSSSTTGLSNIRTRPTGSNPKQSYALDKAIQCAASVSQKYLSDSGEKNSAKDVEWCKNAQNSFGVIFGKSFGTMPKDQQKRWEKMKCNELIKLGKHQSCDQRWGWGFLENWLANTHQVVRSPGPSQVNCSVNMKSSTFCRLTNVMIDFSKIRNGGGTRTFGDGAFTAYGSANQKGSAGGLIGFVPGFRVMPSPSSSENTESSSSSSSSSTTEASTAITAAMQGLGCDVMEPRTTFLVSHDDPFNLAHNANDLIGLWAVTVLANRIANNSLLINMDGFRKGGPAGGTPHRIIRPSDPDSLGPFNKAYYTSWFESVRKTGFFGDKKVCFSELFLPPMPGVPWIWGDWSVPSECASKASSPLYQSFNLFLRHRWVDTFGRDSVQFPDTDRVHIVIGARAIEDHKSKESSARYVKNMAELLAKIESIPRVRVTVQDFALLDFAEQVKLSHSAGVFLSMHGAGVTHIAHAAIGAPNCCALIEMFPDASTGFHTIWGFGNLARHLGMHYYRYEAKAGATDATGTAVDIAEVASLVQHAVDAVKTTPTCLQRVVDTRYGT